MSIDVSRGRYRPLQCIEVEEISSSNHSRLEQMPLVIWQRIAEFFSVKDRFAFKRTCKMGREAGAFVEIRLLREAFSDQAYYLERILPPLQIGTQNASLCHKHLQGATERARRLEKEEPSLEPVSTAQLKISLINRIFPRTLQTYAIAISVSKKKDRDFVEFFRTHHADFLPEEELDEKETAARILGRLHESSRMISSDEIENIQEDTPPEFFSPEMSYSVLQAVFQKLLEVDNRNALFFLVEDGRLSEVSEIDPDFFTTLRLSSVLQRAVRSKRRESIRMLLQLWPGRLGGWEMGEIVRSEPEENMDVFLRVLEAIHPLSRRERCRFFWSWRRQDIVLGGVLTLFTAIFICIAVLSIIYAPHSKKHADPGSPSP